MNDSQRFIQWAREEQTRISDEAMQKRQQIEALLNRMNMELGEANGRMRMLDHLIHLAETGQWPGQEPMHESNLPHPTANALDGNSQ